MLKFFKNHKKKATIDTHEIMMKELEDQTKELKELHKSFRETNESLESSISRIEERLFELGYSKEDLERIERKSKLHVVK